MASKQLGKLRQWAGEVISSREKTVLSEEFQELERDVELRRSGNERLYFACDAYHHSLKKKKDCLALDDPEKLLPIDILGIVMITHGEECGESTLGTSLVKLGRAHCKVATLQEGYALTFRDTYMSSIEKFGDEIKEYDQMRKKLDSRRLSYDAALSKAEKLKTSKKDKEKKEAEDEMEKAQARYEEAMEDVRAHMDHIQAYEIDQMRELTALLDVELDFVEKYAEVLREVKKEWPSISSVRPATRTNGILKSKEKGRKASVKRATSTTRSTGHSTAVESADEDDEDETRSAVSRPSSRRSSVAHHRSDSFSTNKSRSRPSSRASRKRADSTVDQDKADKASTKRMSMAGFMGSFSGRGKKKFANLDDDEESVRGDIQNEEGGDMTASPVQSHKSFTSSKGGRPRTHSKSKSEQYSGSASGTGSPGFLSKLQSHMKDSNKEKERERVKEWDRDNEREEEKKMVRALHDFSGSSDELSFKTGDEIVVVNEVLDGWWMGELRGRRGLFPVPYTEPVPAKPPLPVRPDLGGSHGGSNAGTKPKSKGSLSDSDDGGYRSSEVEDSEVYGSRPLAPDHSPFFGGSGSLPDSASFRSSLAENDSPIGGSFLKPSLSNNSRAIGNTSTTSTNSVTSSASSSPPIPYTPYNKQETTPKKVPPPPPPRRSTGNLLSVATPPIPPRRPGPTRTQSSSGSLPQYFPSTGSMSSHDGGYDVSPFDSATELSGTAKKSSPF
ncbi:hypothetical protein PM082_019016 [Marasmius tenuissimus]|nr:hypothetical protein PM082_019016 [Marasmius tenuissimus]